MIESVSDKLRVVMIGGYSLDSNQIRGGVQAATAYLLKGLAKIEGLDLHVLTLRPSEWSGPDQFVKDGVCVHLLPSYPRFERLHGYRRYQSMVNRKLITIKPSLIHAQEASSDGLVAIRSGFPTVITTHGIRAEDVKYISSFPQRIRFYFDSLLTERFVIHKVKFLIAISHYVSNYFSSILRPDVDLEFIPNALDESFFKLMHTSLKPVVLFVGRVIPLKRVHDLVQAFIKVANYIPEAELRIAGEISSVNDYVKSIRMLISQSGLGERIQILGELSQKDVLKEYSNCSLVVLPSSQENSPMVIAQAMAAAKPVVATRVGGVAEMVGLGRERGILINVGDIDELATSIIDLLQSKERCVLTGQAGRAFALENYHPQRVAQRTYEFYRHISSLKSFPNE